MLSGTEELARAAELQILLADAKAVARGDERGDARLRLRGPRLADEVAARGPLAASDAPAQLMQAREAEAVGVLDHHHRRVRHVDADLDDRGRDEHVERAGGEALHDLSFLLARERAVDERDAQARELAFREPLELGLRRLEVEPARF